MEELFLSKINPLWISDQIRLNLAAIMVPSLILHFDIYCGGLQFRRMSTVVHYIYYLVILIVSMLLYP